MEQAHALAARVADEFDVRSLWTSDLARAAVTAEIVGQRIGLEPRLDPRLREGDRGDWEGRLFVDIAREEPEAYAAWMRGGSGFRFPGGESLQEHSDRVWQALQEIRAGAAAAGAGRLPSGLDPCGPLPLRSARAGRVP